MTIATKNKIVTFSILKKKLISFPKDHVNYIIIMTRKIMVSLTMMRNVFMVLL
jgi:hypothetical protein